MSKTTFKKIVVMTVPGDITADALKKSIQELVTKVEDKSVTDILVDVTELSEDDAQLKKIGEATGEWARKEIDPILFKYNVQKIAFVSSSGNYHGRDERGRQGEGPILTKNAPAKHYFTDHSAAINWLHS